MLARRHPSTRLHRWSGPYDLREQPERLSEICERFTRTTRAVRSIGAASCAAPSRWALPAPRPPRWGRWRRLRAALAQQAGRRRYQDPARRRRMELHVGQREARRDRARRVRRRAADVRRVHDSRASSDIRFRSCSCTAAVVRAPTGWARLTAVPAGSSIWFRKASRSTSSIDRDTGGRRCIPSCTAASPAQAAVLENIAGRFTPPSANPAQTPNEYQKNHNQWPGAGNVGSPDLDQLVAGQGGSYVQQTPPGGGQGGGAGRQGGAPGGVAAGAGRGATPPVAANTVQPPPALNVQHAAWRQAGADLLDRIGPAIIMTHSAGGPFGLLVAEARPNLVKATVIIEGAGSGFAGGNRWGMSSIPVTYDPPVSDPAEIKTQWVATPEPGVAGYFLQTEPARRLPKLRNTRVVFVTADSSFASPGNPGGAGVSEAGWRAGRGAATGHARHQGQRPHDDGREEQPSGAAADRRLDHEERDRQQQPVTGAAPRIGRLARVEAGRHRHLLGGHRQQEEDALRHDSRRADVRAVLRAGRAAPSAAGDPRARRRRTDGALHGARRHVGLGAPLRSVRLQGLPRRSTRVTAARRITRMRSARLVRWSPTICSRATRSRPRGRRTSSGRARAATSAIRWSISSSRPPTRRRATRSWRSRCGR